MSGAGFTPGPWNVQSDGQIWCDDHPIAEKITTGPWGDEGVNFITGERTLVHHWGTVATDEAKANALLIAAAPELYEAAQTVLDGLNERIDSAPSNCVPVFAGIADLASALAKARGDQ